MDIIKQTTIEDYIKLILSCSSVYKPYNRKNNKQAFNRKTQCRKDKQSFQEILEKTLNKNDTT